MYNVSLLILYYFFYSALGWLVESIYCSLAVHKWVNRGFLTGPLCPIYGAGALVLIVFLRRFKEMPIPVDIFGVKLSISPLLVFIAGMVLADIVEFITSLIMEKLFHARWWDYSEKPFNIQGRICLQHTIYWGIGSVVFLYLIDPFFKKIAENIPQNTAFIIIGVILFVFILDLINAVRTAMDIRKVMDKVHKLSETISKVANDIKGNVEVRFDEFQATAAKRAERFALWRSDVSKQMMEIVETLGSSIRKKNVDKEKLNRLITGYPNLSRVAKKQLKSLEELLSEIKKRITDDDNEMY